MRVGFYSDSWHTELLAIRENFISDTSVELRRMERSLNGFIILNIRNYLPHIDIIM